MSEELVIATEQLPFTEHNVLMDAAAELMTEGIWQEGSIQSYFDTLKIARNEATWEVEPTGEKGPGAALNLVYGERIVGEGGQTKVEHCDPSTRERISDAVHKVLGEHTRVVRYVTPPNPDDILATENTAFWLEKIKSGVWPIYVMKDEQGGTHVWEHDERAEHLGNMVLMPREMQDQISEATTYAEVERSKKEVLVLEGEDPNQDPYSAMQRGNARIKDGVDTIDQCTGDPGYLTLLSELVTQPPAALEEVFGELTAYTKQVMASQKAGTPIPQAPEALTLAFKNSRFGLDGVVGYLAYQGTVICDIANYNTRHREGRQLQPNEAEAITESYWRGILRVAQKIRGEMPHA